VTYITTYLDQYGAPVNPFRLTGLYVNALLVRRRRGRRAGSRSRARRNGPTVTETGAGKIPVVFTHQPPSRVDNSRLVLYRGRRDVRRPVRRVVRRTSSLPINIGLFNAQSVGQRRQLDH